MRASDRESVDLKLYRYLKTTCIGFILKGWESYL